MNLYDYPLTELSHEDLERLLQPFKFEDVLRYVALRTIVIHQESRPSTAHHSRSRGQGRSDVEYFFAYLRKLGVKQVLRVIIEDTGSPAHSDEAIENALKNMGVENFDWRQHDLCSDTIFQAAPSAREVTLYWHGSNAILRSWSEPEGLPKLEHLERVVLLYSKVQIAYFSIAVTTVADIIVRAWRLQNVTVKIWKIFESGYCSNSKLDYSNKISSKTG